jgi:hypothetical protein
MGNAALETVCIAIDSENVTSERPQASGHGSGAATEIGGTNTRTREASKNPLADEFVKTVVRRGARHGSSPYGSFEVAATALLYYG